MLGNTPVQRINIQLESDKSFALFLRFADAEGNAEDTTSATVRLVAVQPQHQGGAVALTATAVEEDHAQGRVKFLLQASDLDLEPGSYPYDITLVTESEYSIPVLKGELLIGSNTDADTSNIYSDVDPGSELLVTLSNGNTVDVCLNNLPGKQGNTGPAGPKGDPTGVFIQVDQPGNPGAEPPHFPLWVDTDDEPPTRSALLIVQSNDPGTPDVGTVFWYDTSYGPIAPDPAPPGSVRIKSGNISAWQTTDTSRAVNEMQELGMNSVLLPVRVSATTVSDPWPWIDAADLAYSHQQFDALPEGTKVFVEPYPWIDNGNQSETLWNPSSMNDWFTFWGNACETIAEEFPDTYGFFISSNMPYMEKAEYFSQWQTIVNRVRAKTSAKLTYRTNWWFTATWDPPSQAAFQATIDNPVWGEVDLITCSAYFELTDTPSPSADEIAAQLHGASYNNRGQNVVEEITRFHKRWGKPVFFGELSCPHWPLALTAPWDPDVSAGAPPGPEDPANANWDHMVQRNMYEAYVREFSKFPWWEGFSVFNIGHPYADSGYVLETTAKSFLRNLGTTG